jgi:hypothetical protein
MLGRVTYILCQLSLRCSALSGGVKSAVAFEELLVAHIFRNSFAFYGTRTLTTVFTRALSPDPCPKADVSSPRLPILFIFYRSILICSHVRGGIPSGLFPSRCVTQIPYTFMFCRMRVTCLTHLSLLDLIIPT